MPAATDEQAKSFWEVLAETVRITAVTKKVAGRTVPNSTHYTETVTKTGKTPFKK